jgi:transcriptional regulator with XRE-family HTH domain
MRDERVGAALRAIRVRSRLRQVDLASKAGLSQSTVSRIERGRIHMLRLEVVRAAFEALGSDLVITPRWNGAALDRLLDQRHALLSADVLRLARVAGWDVAPEVSFSRYGERGSIDLLGTRPSDRAAVVVEIKTELGSIEDTQRRLDMKVRLAPAIVFERLAWRPSILGLLVLPEGRATRLQLERHRVLLSAAFPARGWAVRRWLQNPDGHLAGLWVLSNIHGAGATRVCPQPSRVRCVRRATTVPPKTSRDD